MKITVLSKDDALKHIPEEPTYVIRIGPKGLPRFSKREALINSDNYIAIREYFFDSGEISNSEAEKIVRDFKEKRGETSRLLVHCGLGECRSPAVAQALNSAYNLGNNELELKGKFPMSCPQIYNTLIQKAVEIEKI